MTELESNVLGMFLAGDHPTLATLRRQLNSATVAGRNLTGVGFFTDFHIPEDVPRLSKPKELVVGDVVGELSGVPCGFLLFIKDGALRTLEGFVYGNDKWPTAWTSENLHYVRQRSPGSPSMVETIERDHAAIQEKLGG